MKGGEKVWNGGKVMWNENHIKVGPESVWRRREWGRETRSWWSQFNGGEWAESRLAFLTWLSLDTSTQHNLFILCNYYYKVPNMNYMSTCIIGWLIDISTLGGEPSQLIPSPSKWMTGWKYISMWLMLLTKSFNYYIIIKKKSVHLFIQFSSTDKYQYC
jgi:hypothetical protein